MLIVDRNFLLFFGVSSCGSAKCDESRFPTFFLGIVVEHALQILVSRSVSDRSVAHKTLCTGLLHTLQGWLVGRLTSLHILQSSFICIVKVISGQTQETAIQNMYVLS